MGITNTLAPIEISKVRWKSQVYAHLFFGLWMGVLAVGSWGVGLIPAIQVGLVYLTLYLVFYIPVFYILPKYSMREIQPLLHKADSKTITDDELKQLITYILNMPLKAIVVTIIITSSAFSVGSLVWITGVIPELVPLIITAISETIVLGIVVTIYEGLVNYALFSRLTSKALAKIAITYPQVLFFEDVVKNGKVATKLRNIIILTVIAGELSVMLFFITLLSANRPDVVLFHLLVGVLLLILTIIYAVVLSPKIAETYVGPLKAILSWGNKIAEGKLDSRMDMLTGDELMVFVNGANNVMDELEGSIGELKESATLLAMDRDLIEGERNKLSVVVSGIEDGVVVLNENRQIIMINPATQSLLGWNEKEMLGEPVESMLLMYEDSHKIGVEELLQLKSDKKTKEVSIIKKDNEKRLVRVTADNISGDKDNDSTVLITLHDISREREIEKMKFDFVSMAATELRSPLTSMKGYVSLLVNEKEPIFDDEKQVFLERVDVAVNELNTLVDNLLSITKIEQGGLQLAYDSIAWRELIDEVVHEHSMQAEQKGIQLQVQHSDSDVFAIVDRMRIKEVFNNLVGNAIKYSPKGSSVNITYEMVNDTVKTEFSDNGIGIPKEDISKLFKKFYRVEKHSEKEHGTGLGLYISKKIVERHKGIISIKSVENEGSVFTVVLPVKNTDTR